MKFTQSKDGKKRTSLTVSFRIGYCDLIDAICYTVALKGSYEPDEVRAMFKSRTATIALVKETCINNGLDHLGNWSDFLLPESAFGLSGIAKEIVDKLFPEIGTASK